MDYNKCIQMYLTILNKVIYNLNSLQRNLYTSYYTLTLFHTACNKNLHKIYILRKFLI